MPRRRGDRTDRLLIVAAGRLRVAEAEQRIRIIGRCGTKRLSHQCVERRARKSARFRLLENAQRVRRLSGFEQGACIGQPIECFARFGIQRSFEMRDALGNAAALNDHHAQIVLCQRQTRLVPHDKAIKPFGFGRPPRLVLGDRLLEQVVRVRAHRSPFGNPS